MKQTTTTTRRGRGIAYLAATAALGVGLMAGGCNRSPEHRAAELQAEQFERHARQQAQEMRQQGEQQAEQMRRQAEAYERQTEREADRLEEQARDQARALRQPRIGSQLVPGTAPSTTWTAPWGGGPASPVLPAR